MIKLKKEAIVFGILILICINLVGAVEYTYSPSNFLSSSVFAITSLRYDPYPVLPGEKFEIWMKVEPKGSNSIENASCKVNLVYPFISYDSSLIRNFGKLNPGQSVILNYNLKVDQNATVGNNPLEIWCTDNPANPTWFITNINVSVESRYPTLNIINIRTNPEVISPGEESQLLLTLLNSADSNMKDISLKLDLSNVEISSSGEVAEKNIKFIEPGKKADISFSIKAVPGIKGGIYKVPFNLKYTDNLGNAYNQTGLIGIDVSSEPELLISVDSTSISKSNSLGMIDIKIVNSGLTDIKYVSVKLEKSSNYNLLSSDTFYIGNIDTDDFGTAEFKVSAKTFFKNSFDLPLEIKFRDSVNNEHIVKTSLKFDLLTDKELGIKSSPWTAVFFLIIIIVLLLIFVKKLRYAVMAFFNSVKDKFL